MEGRKEGGRQGRSDRFIVVVVVGGGVDGWSLGWTPFFSTVGLARLGLVAKAKRVGSERKVRGKL